MYENKASNGKNNLCGKNVKLYRLKLPTKPSQRVFSEMLQRAGIDVDKNAIQRIESGSRFVTNIEIKVLAEILNITLEQLLED